MKIYFFFVCQARQRDNTTFRVATAADLDAVGPMFELVWYAALAVVSLIMEVLQCCCKYMFL